MRLLGHQLPETFFGNVFRDPDLTQMLRTSPARREFVERPKHLVERRGLPRMPLPLHLPRRLPRPGTLQRARAPCGQISTAKFIKPSSVAPRRTVALLRRQLLTGAKKPPLQTGPARMTTVATP